MVNRRFANCLECIFSSNRHVFIVQREVSDFLTHVTTRVLAGLVLPNRPEVSTKQQRAAVDDDGVAHSLKLNDGAWTVFVVFKPPLDVEERVVLRAHDNRFG